jgi:hypothetical protein
MEDRNILWGELVGGLLIVGCSIALVISLWQSLEQVPYFPFLLFTAITAALFAAGEYTLHHWKLESTSRGLLIISLLLTPLNLLVLADPSAVGRSGVASGGPTDLAVKLVTLLGFVALTRRAGRDVLSAAPLSGGPAGASWLLPVGIVGTSAVPLLGSRLLGLGSPVYLLLLGGLAEVSLASVLLRLPRAGGRGAASVFTLIGLCTFAAAVALGFLAMRYPETGTALHYLGAILPFGGWCVLRSGTRLGRGIAEEGQDSGGWRTAATAVVVAGTAVMLIGEALAWPSAVALMAASAINGVLLSYLAFVDRSPWMHAAALPCLALFAVLGYHTASGNVPADVAALVETLLSPASAAVLAGCVAALTALGEWLVLRGRPADALTYALGAAGAAVVALATVSADGFGNPLTAAAVYATCSACALASNFRWRRPLLAYAGLGLAVAASLWALHGYLPGQWPLRDLLLATESALLALGYLRTDRERSGRAWRDVGLAAAALAVVLAARHPVEPAWSAALAAALAVTGLLLALADRSPGWLAACQTAAAASALFAANAWMRARGLSPEAVDPGALQTYAIALALFCLVWQIARIALRTSPTATAIGLFGYLPDRAVLACLVPGQLALALVGVGPGVVAEMMAARTPHAPVLAETYGPAARVLLAILAALLVMSLRERARVSTLLGLMLLAITVPVLVSGPFSAELATATALRWGLAACSLCLTGAVLIRGRVARLAGAAGIRFPVEANAAAAARGLLDLVSAVVILLTVWLAVIVLSGGAPAGPGPGSFFARVGLVASAAVPLALVVLGTSGFAIRERSPVYAFIAGLIGNATLVGSDALARVTAGGTIGEAESVRLLQLATLGSAAWALAWVRVRRWLYAGVGEGEVATPALARPLLAVQIALAIGGNFVLLGGAVAARGNLLVEPLVWSTEAGSRLGVVTLAVALVAFAAWQRQRHERLTWQAPFFAGLTLPVLLACVVERANAGSGFGVLLLAWPAYLLLWSVGALRPDVRRRFLPGVKFEDAELPVGVGLASLFTVLVVAKAIAVREAYLPAAAATVLTASAFAALAVGRRSAILAFLAASLGNVAVSLIVVNHFHDTDFSRWWLTLVRANVVASAVAALGWMATRHLLRDPSPPGILLAVQATLGLTVNTALLLVPLSSLLLDPGAPLPAALLPDFPGAGWPALLLASAAAFWHCRLAAPGWRIDVLGLFGLSAGVLVACLCTPATTPAWLAYHVLCATWGALGMGAVVLGSAAHALRLSGVADDERQPLARWFADLVPAEGIRRWVEIAGGAVVLLALRGGWEDPYRPYPSAVALVLVSAMAAALAMWFRRARHVWASGLLLNLAFVVVWINGGSSLGTILLTNAIGLATAAAFWTLVALALPGDGLPIDRAGAPFSHLAAVAGWGLVVTTAVLATGADLGGSALPTDSPLTWPAVCAVGVALLVALRDRSAGWSVPALYGLGLPTLGLALHAAHLRPDVLARTGALALAAYVLTGGLFRRFAASECVRLFRLPTRSGSWFAPAQLTGALLVAGGSAWFSVGFPALDERLTGALVVSLLVPAVALLGAAGRSTSLGLATVALAEVACALPDPGGPAPWLCRTAWLLTAFTVASLAFSHLLTRLVKRSAAWSGEARFAGTTAGLLAIATLLALLPQEFVHFKRAEGRTPLDYPLVILAGLCVVRLMVSAVRAAVRPGFDLLGLSERGRAAYVYGVEALLVLLFLHVRLNVPQLFAGGWAGKFWPLIVMALAFLGVGLGEFFDRRGLPVLSGPIRRTGIFLPLLPLIAFWTRQPAQSLLAGAETSLPGAVPMLTYLAELQQHFDRYALLWMLCGLLYAWQAVTRRSFRFGLLAALAANMGVWALLYHGGIPFVAHPQLWMIPLAAIILVSEYVNRDQLSPDLAAGLRYLGVCTVYVSSTADLFIAGLDSVLLPIVLATLAVAGVLAGIVFRVRGFLFMGLSFLLLDILAMIWHVAVDRYQPWLWWVSGIVLGVAILAVFAVFEKRRNDVLRLIEEIRRWN